MKFNRLILILLLIYSVNFNQLYSQNLNNNFVVVLDAGHGGKDPGNTGNGYYEKNISLNIALAIGKKLESNEDINIIYTRKTDVFIDLFKRANIANSANADLFVSIHCDAHNSDAYGAGTFVLGLHANSRNFEIAKKENSVIFLEDNYEINYDGFDPNNPESVIGLMLMQEEYLDQSITAAASIQKRFVNDLGRKNRTVKQAGFIVLKYTYMPSVLVETGFLTNKKEGSFLNSKEGQNLMANSIAKAILDYKKTLDNSFNDMAMDVKPENEKNITKDLNEQSEIDYKIQIAASKNLLELQPYNFKGLKQLTRSFENQIYRYYQGSFKSYKLAKKELKKIKRKGFKEAFVVPFLNNKKTSLQIALEIEKNIKSQFN